MVTMTFKVQCSAEPRTRNKVPLGNKYGDKILSLDRPFLASMPWTVSRLACAQFVAARGGASGGSSLQNVNWILVDEDGSTPPTLFVLNDGR